MGFSDTHGLGVLRHARSGFSDTHRLGFSRSQTPRTRLYPHGPNRLAARGRARRPYGYKLVQYPAESGCLESLNLRLQGTTFGTNTLVDSIEQANSLPQFYTAPSITGPSPFRASPNARVWSSPAPVRCAYSAATGIAASELLPSERFPESRRATEQARGGEVEGTSIGSSGGFRMRDTGRVAGDGAQ